MNLWRGRLRGLNYVSKLRADFRTHEGQDIRDYARESSTKEARNLEENVREPDIVRRQLRRVLTVDCTRMARVLKAASHRSAEGVVLRRRLANRGNKQAQGHLRYVSDFDSAGRLNADHAPQFAPDRDRKQHERFNTVLIQLLACFGPELGKADKPALLEVLDFSVENKSEWKSVPFDGHLSRKKVARLHRGIEPKLNSRLFEVVELVYTNTLEGSASADKLDGGRNVMFEACPSAGFVISLIQGAFGHSSPTDRSDFGRVTHSDTRTTLSS